MKRRAPSKRAANAKRQRTHEVQQPDEAPSAATATDPDDDFARFMRPVTIREKINLTAVHDVVLEHHLSPDQANSASMRTTWCFVRSLADVLEHAIRAASQDADDAEPAPDAKRPRKHVAKHRMIATEFRSLYKQWFALWDKKGKAMASAPLSVCPATKQLFLEIDRTYVQSCPFGIGRLYPKRAAPVGDAREASALDNVTAALYLPSDVRAAATATKTAQDFVYASTHVEIDQSSAHIAILYNILRASRGEGHPDTLFVRNLLHNKVEVRSAVAAHYVLDLDALHKRRLSEKYGDLLRRPHTRWVSDLDIGNHDDSLVDQFADAFPREDGTGSPSTEVPLAVAKEILLGVMFGMSLDTICPQHCVALRDPRGGHAPDVVHFHRIVQSAPDDIAALVASPRAPPCLRAVSFDNCVKTAAARRKQSNSATAMFMQTVELIITRTAMEYVARAHSAAQIEILAHDGFHAANGALTEPELRALNDHVNQALDLHGIRFELKPGKTFDLVQLRLERSLADPEDDFLHSLEQLIHFRTQQDPVCDVSFLDGVYEAFVLNAIDPQERDMCKRMMAGYFGKFYMHGDPSKRELIAVEWDPVVPWHIVSFRSFARTSPVFMAKLSMFAQPPLPHGSSKVMLAAERKRNAERRRAVVVRTDLPFEDPDYLTFFGGGLLPSDPRFGHCSGPERSNKLLSFASPPLVRHTFDLRRMPRIERMFYNRNRTLFDAVADGAKLLPLFSLMFLLVGYEVEAFVYLLRLIACRIIHPHELIPVLINSSSAQHGVGKNLLFEVLLGRRMLGMANLDSGLRHLEPALALASTDAKQIAGTFNGIEEGKSLIIYDEVAKMKDDSFAQFIKALVTSQSKVINEKFQVQRESINKAMVVLLTNEMSSVRVEKNNRRQFLIRVAAGAGMPHEREYAALANLFGCDEWCYTLFKFLHKIDPLLVQPNKIQASKPKTRHEKDVVAMLSGGEIIDKLWTNCDLRDKFILARRNFIAKVHAAPKGKYRTDVVQHDPHGQPVLDCPSDKLSLAKVEKRAHRNQTKPDMLCLRISKKAVGTYTESKTRLDNALAGFNVSSHTDRCLVVNEKLAGQPMAETLTWERSMNTTNCYDFSRAFEEKFQETLKATAPTAHDWTGLGAEANPAAAPPHDPVPDDRIDPLVSNAAQLFWTVCLPRLEAMFPGAFDVAGITARLPPGYDLVLEFDKLCAWADLFSE